MELDKRVQALEEELQVVKNQIQQALLDIQEQLLSHAYPELHAEDVDPGPTAPIRSASVNPSSGSTPTGGEPVSVRRVSLDDLSGSSSSDRAAADASNASTRTRGSNVLHLDPRPQSSAQPVVSPRSDIDFEALEKMESWLSSKIKSLGLKRTYHLVMVYAERGHFSPQMRDAMVEYLRLCRSEQRQAAASKKKSASASPARSSRPAPKRQITPAPKSLDSEENRNIILRLIAGVASANTGDKKRG